MTAGDWNPLAYFIASGLLTAVDLAVVVLDVRQDRARRERAPVVVLHPPLRLLHAHRGPRLPRLDELVEVGLGARVRVEPPRPATCRAGLRHGERERVHLTLPHGCSS